LSTVPQSQGTKKTILIVEDNSAARMALEVLLDAAGFRVFAAGDAAQAEAIFASQAHAIDLLISDLMLPQIKGPEVYERLKRINPSLRCVLMSGFPLADEQDKLHTQGIRHWIQKPFTINDLIALVESALAE
jgi:two-component system cell cycle sensor histidine kinase/response regulator CckA